MSDFNKKCLECSALCCKFVTVPLEMADFEYDRQWLQTRGFIDRNRDRWVMVSRCPKLNDHDACTIYGKHPKTCKEFEVDGEGCKAVCRYTINH